MKDRLTLLLVLKNRHNFTGRWLDYANIFLKDYKILIADGSPIDDKYNFNKDNFPNLKVEIPKFPYDENIGTFIKKIRDSLNIIDTEYVLYCENDDFMIANEISNVLDFLDKNNDFISGKGEIFNFSVSSVNELYGKIIEVKQFNEYVNLGNENLIERLKLFSKNRHSLYHNIIRTEVLKDILRNVIEKEFFDLVTFQYFWNFYIPIAGKIFCSNNLYMLHQNHRNMISKNTNLMGLNESFIYNEQISDRFYETLSLKISAKCNLNLTDSQLILIKLFLNNQLLDLIKDNKINKNSLKTYIIKVLQKNKFTNYLLGLKQRIAYKEGSLFYKEVNMIQNFLSK